MTETNPGEATPNNYDKAEKNKWVKYAKNATIVLGATVFIVTGIALIIWTARTHFDPPKDTEVGIPAVIAFLGFVAVLVQIIVNVFQWRSMQDAQRQNKEFFELAERPSLGKDGIQLIVKEDGGADMFIIMRNSGRA